MTTWQSSTRASALTRRLSLAAAIAVVLVMLGTGCGGTGTATSASPTASPSATDQAGMLPDSQTKSDAVSLEPGTYTAELGGKLPSGRRDVVDWYKVRVVTGQGVINLKVTVPKGATYYEEILTPDGKALNKGSFAGPQFGIDAPVGSGLFYISLEAVQGRGRYTMVLTLH
jgi:hypothetical protein